VLRSLEGDISIRDGHTEFNRLQGTREITHTELLGFFSLFLFTLC